MHRRRIAEPTLGSLSTVTLGILRVAKHERAIVGRVIVMWMAIGPAFAIASRMGRR